MGPDMLPRHVPNAVNGDRDSPSVIIIGAGASGIAAASKLLQNGFENVTILEAEDRIGGRIYTTQFDNYMVDLGGQWVHGEVGNVAFELAWPFGLLERGEFGSRSHELFDSSGNLMDQTTTDDIFNFFLLINDEMEVSSRSERMNGSLGEYFEEKLNEYFEAHPNLQKSAKGLMHMFNMMEMASESADSWYDVSRNMEYRTCPGDYLNNWKERGYSTILDILMKRYPNPEEELPVLKKTKLNAEVSLINNAEINGKVSVTTTSGDTHYADHVIVTLPLGVLKEQCHTLFQPPLSEDKVKTIKGIGFGSDAKIILSFEEPWWSNATTDNGFDFFWTDEDRAELENDPEKNWLLGLYGFFFIEHKPRLLYGWVSGKYSRDMERIPHQQVFNQTFEVLQKFLGRSYDVTVPTEMIRSTWNSNAHFRGTYSFRSLKTDVDDVWHATLAEPIGKEKPVILFAGEATNPYYYSTVHGAIASGWREADRLIQLYPNIVNVDVTTQPNI